LDGGTLYLDLPQDSFDFYCLLHGRGALRRRAVLELGEIVLFGTGEELLHNPEVEKAYLGL
jgi:hypothetical protein